MFRLKSLKSNLNLEKIWFDLVEEESIISVEFWWFKLNFFWDSFQHMLFWNSEELVEWLTLGIVLRIIDKYKWKFTDYRVELMSGCGR